MSWQPESPAPSDTLQINLSNLSQKAWLHWGINKKASGWTVPSRDYIPKGSSISRGSARTPFIGPGEEGTAHLELGPFNGAQSVQTIDFALQLEDGSWENNKGQDFQVPVGENRVFIDPISPSLHDRILVNVRRPKTNSVLHWGVNEGESWQVPHEVYWPSNTTAYPDGISVDTELPPEDWDGLASVVLGPFNQPQQLVTSLHFTVRDGNTWDVNHGRNYNFDLAPAPSGLSLAQPESGTAAKRRLTCILGTRIEDRPVQLFINGHEAGTIPPETNAVQVSITNLAYGMHTLTAFTTSRGHRHLAQAGFWHVPDFLEEPPPEGARPGAAVLDNGDVLFTLFAPGKRFVMLTGSFNDWSGTADPMNLAPDGTWWIRKQLEPGMHEYQFNIEGRQLLADPYSRQVRWENDLGQPSGSPQDARTVLDLNHPPGRLFKPVEGYVRPGLDELLIYELFIPDLCPGQGYKGVIQYLDDIQAMGYNAIEPLPVTEAPGGEGTWGYDVAFHLAAESSYGTPEDLKALIRECHRRGIAFIVDLVLNHSSGASPLWQLYGDDYDASPYYHLFTGENWGFPDFDQESPHFKSFAREAIRMWIEEYSVDGFRYDATRWVGWSGYNNWGASWFAYAARQIDSNSIQIAEHIPTDPYLMNETEMDTGWHAHGRWRLRDQVLNARISENSFKEFMDPFHHGFSTANQRILYVESHDEQRFIRELMQAGYELPEAMDRALLGAALLVTAPGAAMVYAGQEFAEFTPKIVGMNPLNQHVLELPPYTEFKYQFSNLTRLRTTHPALAGGAMQIIDIDESTGVAQYLRSAGSSHVWVFANFSREPRTVTATPPVESYWEEVTEGHGPVELQQGSTVTLFPGTARVFASR